MASKTITLALITPERELLRTSAESVVIPAHDGELGILPGRAPLMCELGAGQLRYSAGGRTQRFVVDGGFAQVADGKVTVLTNRAFAAEEINEALVQRETAQVNALSGNDDETRAAKARGMRRLSAMRAVRAG
jgi:F-type H+-transporting ATPase subunit epsilon